MVKSCLMALALFLGWLSVTYAAEPKPKECDEAIVLEGMRESRIETELNRRGISDPLERSMHRAEIEKQVDDRIRAVKEVCDKLLRR
jgi:hypothetical protein